MSLHLCLSVCEALSLQNWILGLRPRRRKVEKGQRRSPAEVFVLLLKTELPSGPLVRHKCLWSKLNYHARGRGLHKWTLDFKYGLDLSSAPSAKAASVCPPSHRGSVSERLGSAGGSQMKGMWTLGSKLSQQLHTNMSESRLIDMRCVCSCEESDKSFDHRNLFWHVHEYGRLRWIVFQQKDRICIGSRHTITIATFTSLQMFWFFK